MKNDRQDSISTATAGTRMKPRRSLADILAASPRRGEGDRGDAAGAARKRRWSNQTWNWGERVSHHGNP
jgi:hypothetical protein